VRAPAVLLSLLAALLAAGCSSVGHTTEGNASRGKTLFTQQCASCHTLADAGAQGKIGPNLDEAFQHVVGDGPSQGFDESTVRDVVRGQIAYPVEDPPTEAAGMPANLVEGADADDVAFYVASVVGKPVEGGAGGGGRGSEQGDGAGGGSGDSTDGKAIFASAGCGGCHTLADASSQGNVGPNLDEAKPSAALALDRVTNGKGTMPAFRDELGEAQIRAVADYVAQAAGK